MKGDEKMSKVLESICTKKNLSSSDIGNMRILYDGKEEDVVMDRKLESYKNKLERLILVQSKSTGTFNAA